MRFIVIKEATTLKSLGSKLFRAGREDAPAALERLKAANPHLDLGRLSAGTVLVVPDLPHLKISDDTVGSATFADFAREATLALKQGKERVQAALERHETQHKEVAKLVKSAAVTKLAADDSELHRKIELSTKRATTDAVEAKDAQVQLEALSKGVAEELEKLQRLFR